MSEASFAAWDVAGRTLQLTHLDKLYWPDAGVTKGEVLRYYVRIAPTLLPHFRDRPVTMRIFPEGARGRSFYARERPDGAPTWLRHADYRPKTADHVLHAPLVDDASGLIWLANEGAIEFHLWGSRLPDLAVPDQAIFDLDPGDKATFEDVAAAALHLREALQDRGIAGYAKTSGGRGLHVYIPLAAGHTFERVRAWVRSTALGLAAAYPNLVAAAGGPTHRGGRVTVDYAQNSVGRNTAAPYTLRASAALPVVSTPVSWEELAAGGVDPTEFTPEIVLERVRRRGDLFAPLFAGGEHLTDGA